MFELNTKVRDASKKCNANGLRRDGMIPAVLYVRGSESQPVAIERTQFEAALREVKPGHLPTTRFKLIGAKGKKTEAIIKEIQYHPTTYAPLHIDFEELVKDVPITVKIPIECLGVADCAGIKLGGVLRQVIRYLKVKCLPKDMLDSFKLDVKKLQMNDKRRLRDLDIPNTLRPLAKLDEVAVVIAKR